jgi:peptide/nickel transport system permease protein
MISANRVFISSAPWMVFSPGVLIAITALSFNIVGDELREKYAVRRQDKSL